MLIATQNILYQNRMYSVGESLPCYDAAMTRAWLESGSAIDRTENKVTEAVKASVTSAVSDVPAEPEPKKPTAARKKK